MFTALSGSNNLKSILREMVVERERLTDTQPLHDREACRVGEREVLVDVLGKDLAGAAFVGGAHADDDGSAAIQFAQNSDRNLPPQPPQDERMRFGKDEIGREGLS